MRVWMTSFLVLFGMAELYQWVEHFTLPLPVYILGGAFLAIASNYEHKAGFFFPEPDDQLTDRSGQATPPNFSFPSQSHSSLAKQFNSQAQPVSFTIRQSNALSKSVASFSSLPPVRPGEKGAKKEKTD